MRKIITATITSLLFCFQLSAQLPDGSFAPNFTGVDLNGNSWTLYDILDEGKSVILDLSTTWCLPCWYTHTYGSLDSLYEQYGPNGTDELMVFLIEVDEDTNLACLYGDEENCNDVTAGDYVTGTNYPIIDDHTIGDLLQVTAVPTYYYICPDRVVTRYNPYSPVSDVYALGEDCAQLLGTVNLSLVKTSIGGSFCTSTTFIPKVTFQNLGSAPIYSARLELFIDGNLEETIDWTGNLNSYYMRDIHFDVITLTEDALVEISATLVNGGFDDDDSDNTLAVEDLSSIVTTDNFLTLELLTDEYGYHTYWELVDENENALYRGGNQSVIGGNFIGFYEDETLYAFDLVLPDNGCYELRMYDYYGDGLCCLRGHGYYRLMDSAGNELLRGGVFEDTEFTSLRLNNGITINNNAAIADVSNIPSSSCGAYSFTPTITIQNLGANNISSLEIDVVVNDNNTIASFNWIGTITPGNYGFIELEQIDAAEIFSLDFQIASVNNDVDIYLGGNSLRADLQAYETESTILNLELLLDQFAADIYWQFVDPSGVILASGGNELVGAQGGIITPPPSPSNPGAYENGTIVTQQIILPANAQSGCYAFQMMDGRGNGFPGAWSDAYIKVSDDTAAVIFEEDLKGIVFERKNYPLYIDLGVTVNSGVAIVDHFSIFPNPAQEKLFVNFYLKEAKSLAVSVYDALGRVVETVDSRYFNAGNNALEVDLGRLENGVYFVRFDNGSEQSNQKFIISK